MSIVKITEYDSFSVISIDIEEMDFIKTPKVTGAIIDMLVEKQFPKIVLEFENLYYIDSTGMNSLININRKMKEKQSEMVVVCDSSRIKQLFEIAGIGIYLRFFSTMDDAERYLTGGTKP